MWWKFELCACLCVTRHLLSELVLDLRLFCFSLLLTYLPVTGKMSLSYLSQHFKPIGNHSFCSTVWNILGSKTLNDTFLSSLQRAWKKQMTAAYHSRTRWSGRQQNKMLFFIVQPVIVQAKAGNLSGLLSRNSPIIVSTLTISTAWTRHLYTSSHLTLTTAGSTTVLQQGVEAHHLAASM